MSYKTSIIKMAVKWTPKSLILWVSNFILKDIAELTDFNFDIETKKLYAQTQLVGESETIEVWLEDFSVIRDGDNYKVIVNYAKSNRIWLNNLLAKITGKTWPIPVIPQLASQMPLVEELFKAEPPAPAEQETQ